MQAPRTSSLFLVLDDDTVITEALAYALERDDRTVITCNDLASAEIVIHRFQPAIIVSDIRLTGDFAFEGLDLINFARLHAPLARVILMTGDGSSNLQLEAEQRGAICFLRKPFEMHELENALSGIPPVETHFLRGAAIVRVPPLDTILAAMTIDTVFQPIVHLQQEKWNRLGYEALTRLRSDSPMANPEILFEYASRKQRVKELEFVCLRNSLLAGAEIARSSALFLNVHPHVLSQGSLFADFLIEAAGQASVPLARVVLELTEQGTLSNDAEVFKAIERLRSEGVRFAFDDVGVAYSHLSLIDRIKPAFFKISQQFGTGFEADATRRKLVAGIVGLARQFNCSVILEGIEALSTASAARELGIEYGQGYYFGRPADAGTFVPATT